MKPSLYWCTAFVWTVEELKELICSEQDMPVHEHTSTLSSLLEYVVVTENVQHSSFQPWLTADTHRLETYCNSDCCPWKRLRTCAGHTNKPVSTQQTTRYGRCIGQKVQKYVENSWWWKVLQAALLLYTKYQLGHPEIYLFALSTKTIFWLKVSNTYFM